MPPLLLDADEVAAIAIGLQTAAPVAGLETATLTALAKLSQVVPTRWQARLAALSGVETLPDKPGRTAKDTLVLLALACRANEAVRIRHRKLDAPSATPVNVQPHRLVTVRRRWYLVAWAGDWRVYAVDRIDAVQPLGTRLDAGDPPADAVGLVAEVLGAKGHRVRVRVHSSTELVRELVDPTVATIVESGAECELRFGTDDLDWAARWLVYLGVDLDVIEPPALVDRLHALGCWLADRHVSAGSIRLGP